MKNGLFIFHRDFRIVDNVGLNNASKKCDKVFTCFIFTPEQVTNNTFKSENSVQFMIESLQNLQQEITKSGGKLIVLYDSVIDGLEQIVEELNIEGIFFNEDYTPYAKKRTEKVGPVSISNA